MTRVLIIDDVAPLGRAIQRMLKEEGIEGVFEQDPTAALARLEVDRDFVVILCDMEMGVVNGMDVERVVRARWPELLPRLVYMSGGTTSDATAAFLADRPWFVKPFEEDFKAELLKRIREQAPGS